ncbi:MAG: DegV family protein [Roseburia sp.]|nr:DegV family protein [Roseburia sp.]
MATAVVTDSNSGIFAKEGKGMGIHIVPMPVIINDKTYYEGVDLMHEEFYQCLVECKKVSTSQPSIAEIMDVWDTVFSKGYDELVYIPMSSGLSNSCQTAKIFADEYDGKVHVVDNHRISVTQRQSVEDAVRLAQKGYKAQKIKDILEKTAYDSIIYVGVETLKYLKRGGRITPAAAAMGELLNIKPILIIAGEKLDAFAKARGTKSAKKRLIDAMLKSAEEMKKDGAQIRVGVAGSFLTKEEDMEWLAMVQEAFAGEEIHYDPLTFSVGCHVGPGAFGMGISKKIQEGIY